MSHETQSGVLAAIIAAPGSQPSLGSVQLPVRRPGTTLLQVRATPLNPLDLVIASGTFHSARHESPYVPGSECVGSVLESDRFAVGTLVYAQCHASPTTPGGFAAKTIVADAEILPVVEGLDPVLAAAVGNSGTAAYLPLIETAGLRAGETVLVLGATGAVGQVAVQIARAHGAAKVVGVGRDTGALERVRKLGADATVELRPEESSEQIAARIREVSGPVDVVLDGLYGLPLEAALQVCGQHARVVNVGNSAGPVAQVPAGLLRGRQITLSGFAGLHTSMADKGAALTWLWMALAAGTVQIETRTFPIEELAAAWAAQRSSPHCKSVAVFDEVVA